MMPGKELPAAKGVATKYTKRHEGFATNKECLWHRGHGWSTDCTDQHGLNAPAAQKISNVRIVFFVCFRVI